MRRRNCKAARREHAPRIKCQACSFAFRAWTIGVRLLESPDVSPESVHRHPSPVPFRLAQPPLWLAPPVRPPSTIPLPEALHHVMFRGNNAQPVFVHDDDRRRFVDRLADAVARQSCRLHAFCLMPNHVHLAFHEGVPPFEDRPVHRPAPRGAQSPKGGRSTPRGCGLDHRPPRWGSFRRAHRCR
jgi:Transposase IS200 like